MTFASSIHPIEHLCHLNDLNDGQSKGFERRGQRLFVVRQGERVVAYHNRCPHLGIDLEWLDDQFLDAEGHFIQCAMHGALFLIDSGLCISGPCQNQSLSPIPCDVREGEVFITLTAHDTDHQA